VPVEKLYTLCMEHNIYFTVRVGHVLGTAKVVEFSVVVTPI